VQIKKAASAFIYHITTTRWKPCSL